MRWAVVVALAGCAAHRPAVEPILPEVEPISAQSPEYVSRVVALRTSLGRAAIKLEMRGAEITLHGSSCTDHGLQPGCAVCDLAGESDALDSAVLDSIVVAFDRYTTEALEAAHIERVALCKRLEYEDDADRRTIGTVDLKEKRLFISLAPFIGETYDERGQVTTEDIVHHELFHLMEFERMPELYTDDPEWRLYNPAGFAYRDSRDRRERPTGFVDAYATTNENEDRASVYQYMMARPVELCTIAKEDPIVRTKMKLVWERVATVTNDTFLRKRALCGSDVALRHPAKKKKALKAAARRKR